MSDLQLQSLGLGNRPALILVDLIRGFTDPECPLGSACDDVVEANQELLSVFRDRRLSVFFTTVIYRNENEARVFRDRVPALNVLEPDSPWVQIDQRLQPLPGEPIIEKRWASGFFDTNLGSRLAELDIDSLVITGLTTSGCVRATVVDGLQFDYRVVVPREAVGDRNQAAHEANLFDLEAKYADVSSLQDVLECVAHGTGAIEG
jgi:maleamate amidohydrolase